MQEKAPQVSIVIPVYNEEGSLRELVSGIEQAMNAYDFELIFVDDGSSDGSVAILEEIHKANPERVCLLEHRSNFGKSLALATGMEAVRGEIMITLDADLQNDPKDLPRFYEEVLNGADLVMGWRINRNDPLEKTMPSKLYNWVTSKISGLTIHDFNCGFKACRKELLKELPFYGDMHRYIPVIAHRKGYQVKEIEVEHHPRRFGVSKYGWERYLRGMLDLMTVMMLTTFIFRPMHLFGSIGLGMIALGSLSFLYLFFGRWVWGVAIGTSPLLLVSFFAIGIGVQILIFGLVAEMIVHWQKLPKDQSRLKKRL